jgi:hypothetical protein
MSEFGPWSWPFFNCAVLAFVALIVMIVILRRRGKHALEAHGKVLAEVQLPTGRSLKRLVAPTPDGWVHLGKLGDYRLAGERMLCACGHEDSFHDYGTDSKKNPVRGKCMVDGCACAEYKMERVITAIRRWGKYPERPFLGLSTLQVDVRTESWYYNHPEPITPPENRTLVTAVDAQFHTREIAAEMAAVEIQEQEGRQRELMKAIANQPHKTVVYVLLGGTLFAVIMLIVQVMSQG